LIHDIAEDLDPDLVENQEDPEEEKKVDPCLRTEVDFKAWDFQPQEDEPPQQYTFTCYLDNTLSTLGTYLKKQIKPLTTNSKKAVIQVRKEDGKYLKLVGEKKPVNPLVVPDPSDIGLIDLLNEEAIGFN
jgi:hypothetical protein